MHVPAAWTDMAGASQTSAAVIASILNMQGRKTAGGASRDLFALDQAVLKVTKQRRWRDAKQHRSLAERHSFAPS